MMALNILDSGSIHSWATMKKPAASDDQLSVAHRHSALHSAELERSDLCGCLHCTATFLPGAIGKWIDDRNAPEGRTGETALCPKCGIDSVIGSASGYPITDEFLAAMKTEMLFDVVSSVTCRANRLTSSCSGS